MHFSVNKISCKICNAKKSYLGVVYKAKIKTLSKRLSELKITIEDFETIFRKYFRL
jgi:hypothetical protein